MMGKYTKNTNTSVYTKDFSTRKKMNDLPCITMDFWTSKYKYPAVNMKSINTSDFACHETKGTTFYKKEHPEVVKSDFIGNSTYKNTFGSHAV